MRLRFFLPAIVFPTICGCEKPPAPLPPLPAEVTVSKPIATEITDALTDTGKTEALESVVVRSRVTGFLEKVHFEPLSVVEQGALLFNVDSRPFKNTLDNAKAQLDRNKATYERAEFTFRRLSDLLKAEGAVAEQEMVDARADLDESKAAIDASTAAAHQAQLNYDWCTVTAPIRGRIARSMIDAGNIVAADSSLLTSIVNDESIYLYFSISERAILQVMERARERGGPAATRPSLREMQHPVFLGLMTEEGYPHQGTLDYMSPTVDSATGTMQVRAIFPNKDGRLLAGLFARVRVPIGKPYKALTVTERALGSDQGQRYVLVVNDKNIVEFRPVQVGTLDSGMRVITAGISADDRIIVNGMQRARPGLTVKPIDAPMPVGPAQRAESKPAGNAESKPAESAAPKPAGH